MVWTIHTPTPEEGAAMWDVTPEVWQLAFGAAYWQGNVMMLDALGVDTKELRFLAPQFWGNALQNVFETMV